MRGMEKKTKEFTSSLKAVERERKPLVGTRFACFALHRFSINFAGFDAYLFHAVVDLLDLASVMETLRVVYTWIFFVLILFFTF